MSEDNQNKFPWWAEIFNQEKLKQAANERPHSKWIKQYGKSYKLITNEGVFVGEFTKCPKCQYDKARGSNFCPNFGADMRGNKNDQEKSN